MMTITAEYAFKNGTTVLFTLQTDKKRPIADVEWSCTLNKENMEPIYEEYVTKCVPFIYQKISNLLGQSILWVDKTLIYPAQEFHPDNLN